MTPFSGATRPLYRLVLTLAASCIALPALALDLAWPDGAERMAQTSAPTAGFRLATGAFDGDAVPGQVVDGDLSEEVWRIPLETGAPERVLGLLRDQMQEQDFDIGFACADRACGGFDFRYALPIADAPEMYVDLGQFHYLTATRPAPGGGEHVAITVSRGGQHSYVHLARISPAGALTAPVTASSSATPPPPGAADGGLIARLTETGSAVLSDVTFDTGASSLSDARIDSLVTLAAFLAEDPARRVVMVGHTDAEGTLEANIALSRVRAVAVRTHLIEILGTDPGQVEADGIGYLAPRAANTDAEGREANRRVEVVLIAD